MAVSRATTEIAVVNRALRKCGHDKIDSDADDLDMTGGSGSGATLEVTGINQQTGAITSVSISSAGTGYLATEVLSTTDGAGSGATFTIDTVGGSGEITAVSITTAGINYADSTTVDNVNRNEEGNTEARLAYDLYADVRDILLSERKWRFADKREQLDTVEVTNPDEFKWAYAHDLSNLDYSIIQIIEVYSDETPIDYERQGDYILSDHQVINIEYVAQIRDLSQWPVLAIEALVNRLALEMAPTLLENEDRETLLMQMYERAIEIAGGVDGTQATPTKIGNQSGLVNARFR